ncbi:MAG: hypothetical protein EOM12_14850 [Verrucomicrobiae bacterium]|nr:hypothetical protein [Verrucomicrobiae bacterium]
MTATNKERSPAIVESLAAETIAGLTSEANHQGRIQRYADAKTRAVGMAQFIKENVFCTTKTSKVLFDLETCGNYLVFRNYYTINEIRLSGMCSCRKHLICPLCAIRRGAKSVQAYLKKYHQVIEFNPMLKPYLVTFTIKNGSDLLERFNHLHRSIRLMNQQRSNAIKARRPAIEANKAQGACWSYEIKRGTNSGDWHPHVHAVWLCTGPPDQEQLRQEWKEITGDSHMVDVRPISTEPDKGFLEVFKYAVKFSSMEYADTWEIFLKLSGRRLVSCFGCLYGVQVPEEMTDDDLEEELPFFELFYRYISRTKSYQPRMSAEDMHTRID